MKNETKFEERWPELFAGLTEGERKQAVAACWDVLSDGFQLTRDVASRITTLLREEPEEFARRHAPYREATDSQCVAVTRGVDEMTRLAQQLKQD